MNPRSVLLGVAGLFIIGLFAVATANQRLPFGLGRGREAPEPWSPYRAAAPQGSTQPTLSAAELWALYDNDGAAAL
jgi:hypothetical protein